MSWFKLNDSRLLASLDIGSYSIRCAVFQKGNSFPLELLAWVEKPSVGLQESRVNHFESFHLALGEVLEKGEELCKSAFSEIFLGFSPPFHFFRSQGMAVLPSREVTKADLDLAVQTACAVPLPQRNICLHSQPESFCVDKQKNILNPLGLSGLRLETEVCLVTVPQFYCRDIIKALKLLGYKPMSFFHNLVAFGHSLTSFREKKNGVCLCDIGYKSTRGIVYLNGRTEKMFIIPIGGYHFSQDLASQFNLSLESAERLKEAKGQLIFNSYAEENSIEWEESLYLSRKIFSQTLEKTAEKLLDQIKAQVEPDKLIDKISSGFVFTGGTAFLPGFKELSDFCLGGPVKLAKNMYENFRQTNNWALAEQAYLENHTTVPKQNFHSKKFVWKDLF